MKSLKVLIYSSHFYPSVGGMEIVAETLAKRFHEAGCEVVVATDTPATGSERLEIPVVREPSFWQFLKLCRRSDVVFLSPVSLRRIVPPLLSGRPIVVKHPNPLTGHRGQTRFRDRLKLLLCRRFTNIVAGDYMAGFFPSPVVIPNPYDDSLFYDDGQPKTGDLLFVGRLDAVKGADVLIRAIKGVEPELPTLTATIVGNGPEREHLKVLTNELGLSSRVNFTGELIGDALAMQMRRHRVMVVPSTYNEPFGNVALQGLASGCLLIVSRKGGLADATGPHSLTFENGDALSLSQGLKEAFFEPGLRDHLLNGVSVHLERHHEGIVAQRYLELLHKVSH
ncbi:glycosyltransferase family 4 protein [Bradyrhizobium sp. 187]|uniref:glycosyltransferase family 4 protein n=1 Tax=Bradyrhizobium sp. 187 TaxID=2782655 RepID=UPI001FFE98A3|nr:glycosyltransferase family 4 protein [Bradyrhizobium sp. 187]UPJ74484.1 glycosyltransferase family 4 protein [Bradyrhizobium sp. 187]